MKNADREFVNRFRIMGGAEIQDVFEYLSHVVNNQETSEIHVGCDSQNYRNETVYVTTIVFRYQGSGAHVVYRKERVPKIYDLWTKLWGETERSVELANLIRERCGVTIQQIDLDFNTDPAFPSNKLLSASTGYINSLGYQSKAKPNLLMAVWAANVLCH